MVTVLQAVQDTDGINNNISEVSFDLHYSFETECNDMITEHERPKAPEPMILESISNYDISELLSKDEQLTQCIPMAPNDAKHQAVAIDTTANNISCLSKKRSSNMDLVLEDIDDSDYFDADENFRSSDMYMVQMMSQEPLIENFIDSNESHHLEAARTATTVLQKSLIKSTKANSKSHSSRLRRLASSITRVMSNKFRKFRHLSRAEVSSTSKDSKKNCENQDKIVDWSSSTQHLLQTSSVAVEFSSDP